MEILLKWIFNNTVLLLVIELLTDSLSFEYLHERFRCSCLKVKLFVGNWVVEIKSEGMESEASDGVIAITIFNVPADGATKVLCVHTDLVFSSRLQLKFHERVALIATQSLVVRQSLFTAVVSGRRESEKRFVVFQPTFHATLRFFRSTRTEGNIATVGDNLMPIVL